MKDRIPESYIPPPAGSIIPPPIGLSREIGVYSIYDLDTLAGTSVCEWKKPSHYLRTVTTTLADQSVVSTIEIETDRKKHLKSSFFKKPGLTCEITRSGLLLYSKIEDEIWRFVPGNPFFFDFYSPPLFTPLLRQLERQGRTNGTVSVVHANGEFGLMRITGNYETRYTIKGQSESFRVYHIDTDYSTLEVWLSHNGRVVFLHDPVHHEYLVLKGYEALATPFSIETYISRPVFDYKVTRNVRIPMRDKVKLAADIYFPINHRNAPSVLIRTPYGKQMHEPYGTFWARRGYAAIIQDCRGRLESGGVWEPYVNEGKDGYDTIEWIASQPWSNGKVGMIGVSYEGLLQWQAAVEKPPHLVTIIPVCCSPYPIFLGNRSGTFSFSIHISWIKQLESGAVVQLSGEMRRSIDKQLDSKTLLSLPVIDLDKKVCGKEIAYWRKWMDPLYLKKDLKNADYMDKYDRVRIPVFHQTGWFDGATSATKWNYTALQERKIPHQKLVIGPWGHTDSSHTSVASLDFGHEALIDLHGQYLRWFDYWLKGYPSGIAQEKPVKLFIIGDNQWIESNRYPPAGSEPCDFYLYGPRDSASWANGALIPLKPLIPTGKKDYDYYTYYPVRPTPASWPFYSKQEYLSRLKSQVDILSYCTQPFNESLTLCGPLSFTLYASTSEVDTDWFVQVFKESKGCLVFVAHGALRARCRKSIYEPELVKPGEVIPYTIDMGHMGMSITRGSRLWVEISSACFPWYDRNLNTGENNETSSTMTCADQRVFRSPKYPSCLHLTVLKEKR